MPTSILLRTTVRLPTVDEFLGRYPHYASVKATESFLWDLIVIGENVVAAQVATRLGLPAVTAVADAVSAACSSRRRELSGYVKQMSGAIICSLMMANEHDTTGTKRAVGCLGWGKGEMYRLHP